MFSRNVIFTNLTNKSKLKGVTYVLAKNSVSKNVNKGPRFTRKLTNYSLGISCFCSKKPTNNRVTDESKKETAKIYNNLEVFEGFETMRNLPQLRNYIAAEIKKNPNLDKDKLSEKIENTEDA